MHNLTIHILIIWDRTRFQFEINETLTSPVGDLSASISVISIIQLGEYTLYKKKYKPIILMTCLAILLSLPLMVAGPMEGDYIMSIGERSVTILSTEVWSDDFNDGDISDWTTFGSNLSVTPPEEVVGNFSVEDGSLRAVGPVWQHAYIESTVAYGTWSFDVHVVDTVSGHFYIAFMSTSNFSEPYEVYDYALQFNTGGYGGEGIPFIGLGWHRRSASLDNVDWDQVATIQYPDGLSGWYHIDITRDDDQFFYVYLNGSYIFGLDHNTYIESEYFHFFTMAGPGIDNVEVYDTTEIDLVAPVFGRAFEDQTIALGADFRYDVNATDSSGIDTSTWSVNNSATFAINADGVITNTVALGTGSYGLEVSVDDTWGNTATDSFTIIVGAATLDWTLLAIGGGVVIIALVVCVYCLKKRSAT